MGLSEFDLIGRFFSGWDRSEYVSLGIGDDCALAGCPQDWVMALTTDTLNEGQHFFKGTDPYLLGYKSLAVNISDLAAMGARPAFFLLALTMPEAEADFLAAFARGLKDCAERSASALIGGNTTRGPLSITITACGYVQPGRALRRSAAQPGDQLYVTGTLGLPGLYVEAGSGRLQMADGGLQHLAECACLRPCRAAFSHELAAQGVCRCAIDISDGLIGDLGHILDCSGLSCCLDLEQLPCDETLAAAGLDEGQCLNLACYGGCDYELLLCVSPQDCMRLEGLASRYAIRVTRIGSCMPRSAEPIVARLRGTPWPLQGTPFEHFRRC